MSECILRMHLESKKDNSMDHDKRRLIVKSVDWETPNWLYTTPCCWRWLCLVLFVGLKWVERTREGVRWRIIHVVTSINWCLDSCWQTRADFPFLDLLLLEWITIHGIPATQNAQSTTDGCLQLQVRTVVHYLLYSFVGSGYSLWNRWCCINWFIPIQSDRRYSTWLIVLEGLQVS